jgi:hypothetical protein
VAPKSTPESSISSQVPPSDTAATPTRGVTETVTDCGHDRSTSTDSISGNDRTRSAMAEVSTRTRGVPSGASEMSTTRSAS